MDRQISDLINICRDLNSERGPERRKAAGKLKNVLSHTATKKALDKNHEYKHSTKNIGKIFTWESVFRSVCLYVTMETEELQNANQEVSRTTLNNRETRKQEISALVKYVIRSADKGSPKLKGSLLFDHVRKILHDDYTCESYGQDYCSIFLKNVLSVRKYMMELNTKEWHDLLFMFFKLFNDPDVKIDKLILSQIIHSLVCGITAQCDVRPKKVLSFFTEFFSRAKHQKSSLLLQHMLSALNVFVKAIGPTSRVQLCKLGEEMVPKLPYLWHNVASEELKDELLEFLQTQMWCHHPNGLKKDSPGAYAVDWDRWMSHLKKLYELMYSEIQLMGPSRNRGKISELKQAFVDLAVDVCQQIFSESSHTIEVTQISCTGSDGQTGPSAKKRRLESGWDSIRNYISSAGQTPKMVPWLQLVTGFVSKYTNSVPRDEVMPYLTCLSHALSDCKRTDLMVYIMRCIKSFVANWDKIVTMETEVLTEQSKSTWNQIWMVALRFVSLHNSEPEGYMLLSAMIERRLITPRKDIWSIFMPSLTRPITESIIFLCQCLVYCDFPENYVPNLAVAMPSAAADVKYPLRKQLIHWLLPSRDDETEMSRSHCKLNPDWTAHALMTLTLRDLSAKLKQCTSERSVLSDLERHYLGTALEMPLEVEEALYKKDSKKEDIDPVHISTVLHVIENLIKAEVQYYSSRMEEQVSDVEEAVKFARLVTNLLSLLLGNKILTPQTITTVGLYDSLVNVLKKVSNSLQEIVKKDGYANLCPVVKELRALFCLDDSDLARRTAGTEDCRNVMAAICRAASPSRLVDVLLDIANDKHCASKQTSSTSLDVSLNQSRFHRGASRLLDDFDDELDLEFEDQSNNNDAMQVEDLDFNDGPDSQDSDEVSATNEVCQSLCLPCVLTESQLLRLEAIQALCHWCARDIRLPVKVKSEVDVKYVKSKIASLLEEDVFDPSRAVDIQMMQHVVTLLTDRENTVTENSLRTMVTAVRNCVRCHRRDQEVCRTILELIIRLVPHLAESDSPSSSVLRECRETVMHLANAFWKLQEESYTSDVRCCLAKTMETLLQYDPDCKWSRFPSDQDEDSPSTQGDSGPTPANRLIDCAGDVCHSVRMQAVSAMYKLFVDVNIPGRPPVDRNKQHQMFSQLFIVLNDSLDIQGRLSQERLEDEKVTRIASMLTALGTVICSSPVCEKLAVFSMMQFIKEKDVPVHMVQRILEKVTEVLGYKTHIKYIESYLPFFLHKWLQSGWGLTEFPYKLMGCENTMQFYRIYLNAIIPELVFGQNMEAVEAVGTELGCSSKDLLKDSIPFTVVHILPVFAASKQLGQTDNPGMKKKINRATACYNLLTKELSEEVVDRQIVNGLDEIVANLLMCLYDTESDAGNIRDTNPEPNPPFYNTQTITWTLDYITSSFSGSGKTLIEILSKTTDSIQKILLELSVRLLSCHRMSEKRRTLFMYQLFTRLLLKQFHTQLGGAWVYVLRDVILRLVYLIKDITAVHLNNGTESSYRESIAGMGLKLLREVCHVGVDICPKELMKYLPLLASNLVSTAEHRGDVGQLSLGLLKFLILEKVKELRPAIATLDNFPDKPEFKECRTVHHKLKYAAGAFTLKQEVEHFMSAGRNHIVDPDFRLEGLKFLHEQLKHEQKELQSLASDDTLCRLACELVELTKCENRDVVIQAGKCLGVLGPVNLRTISLPSAPASIGLQFALQCFEELPDVHKYCRIFHCLNTYLTDKSIELVQCASRVLKDLLSVKKGIEFSNGYKTQLGDNEYLFHYLHPFRAGKKKVVTVKAPAVNWDVFQSTVDQELLWNPQHSNHGNWLITLTTTLINSGAVRDELLQLLEPVCSIKVEFCDLVLPYMIHDILVSGTDDHREVMSRQVVSFFSSHCGQSRSGRVSRCQSVTYANIYMEGEQSICMNRDSVRTMIDVIQYLRQQPRLKKGRQEMTIWDNNFWLDVDYLQVAMAAQYCSAHFTALMFAEIWCDVQREKTESDRGSQSQRSSQGSSQDTRIDTLSEASSSQSGVSVQDLLLEAYSWIGDPDGVYGCGAGRKVDTSSRICTYQQENQWDKAVVSCDIQMSQSGTSNQYDLLNALQCFGANHVFNTYLQGIMGQEDVPNLTSDTRELQFEAAWRMGKWNIDSPNKIEATTGFHESVFKAMKSIREDHSTFTDKALSSARLCAVSRLKDGCLTSARRLYPVLADLMCVNIVEQTTDLVKSFRESGSIDPRDLNLILDADSDIKFTLPALYMKCSAVKLLWEKTDSEEVFKLYVDSLHQLAISAREATRHQVSERAIATVKELDIADLSLSVPTQIEEAKLYWARGEENIAKPLLKGMIDKLRKLRSTKRAAAMFYPQALSIYGNWLAETRSENPNIIMENYMERAINMYEQLGESEDKSVDAYLALAKYADAQYQNIVNYMNSSTYEAKQSLMRKSQQEADRLREVMGESAKDRYLRTLEKQTEIDQHELECMQEDRNIFLLKAVHNYIKCLRCGDEHNLRVFRLMSLWFNNVHSEDVNSMMKEAVSEIKTYKWLPLMYQLAARMDVKPRKDTSHPFLQILNKMIYDTAVSHPHHTLFCVLALANANRDTELLQQAKTSRRSKMSKSQPDNPAEEGRVLAAKEMIARLRDDKKVGDIVKDLQTLCDAYIQLANWNVQEYKTQTKPIQLPAQLWLTKVKNLKNVPVPTKEIKVNQSCDYKDIPYIEKFEPTFKLAGGINLPKIISCVGSDGTKSRQLVKDNVQSYVSSVLYLIKMMFRAHIPYHKIPLAPSQKKLKCWFLAHLSNEVAKGRDDLRQDAVMQQVFDMVNNLLQKDSETRKRQLQIRKYKVIPLSQRSGLLEWCEGTLPVGEYLVGSKGAHARYRPQDLFYIDCRNKLTAATTTEAKYKVYQDICDKFRPVFRHFFFEKFTCPPVWFERRLAYTRSVATNSIVGYILGLGDRHIQNILIDCNTAELVHIDLGIAFEQGKILPTPETVPFRLTRDIEDAMGASGVEGVFRRCCEKTMEVMRSNQEALLTILEVLLYDPLHVWTISPAKAYALQQRRGREESHDTVDVGNTTADIMDLAESSNARNSETQENVNKVAERVLLRLRQKLQGVEDGVQLSLSGQVNYLIQEARNSKNLARIFPGWQPYV